MISCLSKRSIVDNDFSGPPRNVILVGTKLDIVRNRESKREVLFTDALKLADRLNLYAAVETSAQDDIEEINNLFSMCAINCFDISRAKQRAVIGKQK